MAKQSTNMARVIGQIQTMARAINRDWFNNELPMDEVVWTVTSQPTSYGFFTPYNSFKIFDKVTGEREAVQISLGSETISRDITGVISTMIHEMTHWMNFIKFNGEVKDCTRNNYSYHNKVFKNEAEKHGVVISHHPKYGFTITDPSEELVDWIISQGWEELRLQENVDIMTLIGGATKGSGASGTTPTKTKTKSNNRKLICPKCGQIARTTNPNHNIVCGDCMERMVEA